MTVSCILAAPAKINLSLHIHGRRADGYHELSGLVAFAEFGDQLQIRIADDGSCAQDWSLQIKGPFASELAGETGGENLVLAAARAYAKQAECACGGSLVLSKNLPVAAGIGGGSTDAAAMLVALDKLCPAPLPDEQLHKIALSLGADVPMCLAPRAQYVSGIGETSAFLPDFEPLPAILVNPLVGVSTGHIFRQLGAGPLPDGFEPETMAVPDGQDKEAFIKWLRAQRNDLQSVAITIAPVVGKVIAAIEQTNDCQLARMSGSGATCFGLYENVQAATNAAQKILATHPDWWVQATNLD